MMRSPQSAPAIDCARVRDSYEAPYAGGQTGSPGGAGLAASGARGGAPGFASAGRSPQRYTGGDDTAKEPQMKQTPAPRKINEAMIHSGFFPHMRKPQKMKKQPLPR